MAVSGDIDDARTATTSGIENSYTSSSCTRSSYDGDIPPRGDASFTSNQESTGQLSWDDCATQISTSDSDSVDFSDFDGAESSDEDEEMMIQKPSSLPRSMTDRTTRQDKAGRGRYPPTPARQLPGFFSTGRGGRHGGDGVCQRLVDPFIGTVPIPELSTPCTRRRGGDNGSSDDCEGRLDNNVLPAPFFGAFHAANRVGESHEQLAAPCLGKIDPKEGLKDYWAGYGDSSSSSESSMTPGSAHSASFSPDNSNRGDASKPLYKTWLSFEDSSSLSASPEVRAAKQEPPTSPFALHTAGVLPAAATERSVGLRNSHRRAATNGLLEISAKCIYCQSFDIKNSASSVHSFGLCSCRSITTVAQAATGTTCTATNANDAYEPSSSVATAEGIAPAASLSPNPLEHISSMCLCEESGAVAVASGEVYGMVRSQTNNYCHNGELVESLEKQWRISRVFRSGCSNGGESVNKGAGEVLGECPGLLDEHLSHEGLGAGEDDIEDTACLLEHSGHGFRRKNDMSWTHSYDGKARGK